MLSVIFLSVNIQSVIMSVNILVIIMLNVIMMNVIMLNVVAPLKRHINESDVSAMMNNIMNACTSDANCLHPHAKFYKPLCIAMHYFPQ
jgi:hypothetical protein